MWLTHEPVRWTSLAEVVGVVQPWTVLLVMKLPWHQTVALHDPSQLAVCLVPPSLVGLDLPERVETAAVLAKLPVV
jgi:hypothetical protein